MAMVTNNREEGIAVLTAPSAISGEKFGGDTAPTAAYRLLQPSSTRPPEATELQAPSAET